MSIETSPEIVELTQALIAVQGEIESVLLNKVNPHFRSKYADLAVIREACKKPCFDNGLAIVQSPSTEGNTLSITTLILHKSGQWLKSTLGIMPEIKGSNSRPTPQAIGSAITYGRRYALSALLGIVAEEDDDGNATANGRTNSKQATSPHPNNYVQRQNTAPAEKRKDFFDKNNPDFVIRLKKQLETTAQAHCLQAVLDELHGKEIVPGLVAGVIKKQPKLPVTLPEIKDDEVPF